MVVYVKSLNQEPKETEMETILIIRNLLIIGVIASAGLSILSFFKLYEQKKSPKKYLNLLKLENPKKLRTFGMQAMTVAIILLVIVIFIW